MKSLQRRFSIRTQLLALFGLLLLAGAIVLTARHREDERLARAARELLGALEAFTQAREARIACE